MNHEQAVAMLSAIARRAVDDLYILRDSGAIVGEQAANVGAVPHHVAKDYRSKVSLDELIYFFKSVEWVITCRITGIDYSAAMRQLGFKEEAPLFDRSAPRAKRPDQRSAFNSASAQCHWPAEDESTL